MLTDCRECKTRFRADKLEYPKEYDSAEAAIATHAIACPNCGSKDLTEPRPFLTMLRTRLGAAADEEDYLSLAYLRPETAQGIFINFLLVQQAMRRKLPFGIAQIGKAFRNEVTPGNFVLRTREFEQMELEYFVKPGEDEGVLDEWVERYLDWYTGYGLSRDNLRLVEVEERERAHYSRRTVDVYYRFFPERDTEEKQWEELMGIAHRSDYDLKSHSKNPADDEGKRLNPDSTEDLSYFDDPTKQRFYPYVIEPSAGVNRSVLAFLMDAYTERTNDKGEKRVILKLHPELAPIKVAVLPLARNKPEIVALAQRIKRDLQPSMRAVYDDTGGIGKLYARQDEIGTPACVTVDHQSLEDEAVTVRDRDTWEQERVPVAELLEHLKKRLGVRC
ncbi:MAG: glycine--tRNA ligase [Acidobacteria bacterium]|nr:glycine--tRNA ligase [Acidobacteriota bacterium]